jgi:hypothetical protein
LESSLKQVPRIAFLGIAERSAIQNDQHQQIHYLFGLRKIIFPFFYPMTVSGWDMVFAIYDPISFPYTKIKIKDGIKELGFIELRAEILEAKNSDPADSARLALSKELIRVIGRTDEWSLFIAKPKDANFAVIHPGSYDVVLEDGENEIHIGSFILGTCELLPLTEDRKAALRSNPSAAKAAKIIYTCNKCNSSLKAYTGLERSEKIEADGFTWYEMLPVSYRCTCGENEVNLEHMRRNMHGLLQNAGHKADNISFVPQYELGALEIAYNNFAALLDKILPEENYQQFLQENNVFFQTHFAPDRIFFKTPIMSKFITDFIILTPHKELFLIEIERPDTPIMKADGGITSKLQAPFTQVANWLHEFNEHRHAVLDCIGLKKEDVALISGVVIAGRDRGYPPEHLRRLKANRHGQIRFFTYDDILAGFSTLIQSMRNL